MAMTEITWKGALAAADQRRVEAAIQQGIRQGLAVSSSRLSQKRQSSTTAGSRSQSPQFDGQRARLRIPSYGDGGALIDLPVEVVPPAATADVVQVKHPLIYTDPEMVIQQHFPETRGRPGPGVYYGAYMDPFGGNNPRLWYVSGVDEQEQAILDSIHLYTKRAGQRFTDLLAPGFYTVAFEADGSGELLDLTRRFRSRMGNPDPLDLRVAFVVSDSFPAPTHPQRPRYRFYPMMHILRLNEESPLATGSESVYVAVVDVWRVDKFWRPTKISLAPFIGIFPDFQWWIHRVKSADARREWELVRVERGKQDYFRHTWETAGDYRVTCEVVVDHSATSPLPDRKHLLERVIPLETKMATLLALAERQETVPGAALIWQHSAADFLQTYEDALKAETSKKPQNKARIDLLNEAIAKIKKQLEPFAGWIRQPFPVHAIFTEIRTSKTQPLALLLAFRYGPDEEHAFVCDLIDLTYQPFFRTYEGVARTPHGAVIAAFEKSRKSLRRTYPPGYIWARVRREDLDAQHLTNLADFREWEFATSTESWEKDAVEWLNIGVQVVGTAAMVASFAFPPSLIITASLVVTGVVAAGLSIGNIVNRVDTRDFRWDVETYSDIANIAASLVGLGAAGAEIRAGSLARVLATYEEVTADSISKLARAAKASSGTAANVSEALSRLAGLAKFQRAVLITGIGLDVANGLILTYSTYTEIKALDAYAEEEKADYLRQFGSKEEAERRFKQDRYSRILGILVRAGLNATMLAVSLKGAQEAMAQGQKRVGGLEPPTEPPPATFEGPGEQTKQAVHEHAQRVAGVHEPELSAQQTRAAEVKERLANGNRTQLLEDLQEFIDRGQLKEHDALAAKLADLDDRALGGLEAIARLEEGGGGNGALDWQDALSLGGPSDAKDLLHIVGDLASRLPLDSLKNLDEVLMGILKLKVKVSGRQVKQVQGSWGQLYAAKTLIDKFGATGLHFEIWEPGRRMDIIAELPGRGHVSVEVKTNLNEAKASFETGELLIDLRRHAKTNYEDLLYLYHPDVAGELDALGQRMLRLFDRAELQAGLTADGIDPVSARSAFKSWLDAKKLGVYQID